MKEIRAGVVGVGKFFGGVHLPCMRRVEGLRIVAGCARREESRQRGAAYLGDDSVKWHADHRDMLAAGGLDAVYVLTPPNAMRPVVIAAAEAGLPIFCEKPPGHVSEDAVAMAEAADAAGVLQLVAWNRRFGPLTRKLAEWIAAGHKPTRIHTLFHRVFSRSPDRIVGSGAHAIDKTISIMGPVRRVMGARSAPREGQGFGSFAASFEFASGACGTLYYDNRFPVAAEEYHMTAVSPDTLTVDHYDLHFPPPTTTRQRSFVARRRLTYKDWVGGQAAFDDQREEFARDDLTGEDDLLIGGGYQDEHDVFAAAVRGGAACGPTFAETVHSMLVAEAIQAGECREFAVS